MGKNLSLQDSIFLASSFALLMWAVKLVELAIGSDLHTLGVYPQTASGLAGILFAPLVHGSIEHILGNTIPVLLLGSMLIYGYPKSRWWVLLVVWISSGIGVWVFARSNYHIGASGLTHGVFFYLFMAGIIRHDSRSSALLMIAFFMYGAMFWTIFPYKEGVSFEYHLFGAISGVICALALSHRDPKPTRKQYSWENEVQATDEVYVEDPIIGDQWKAGMSESDSSKPVQHGKVFRMR